jgi:fructokinase
MKVLVDSAAPARVVAFGEILWDVLPEARLLGGAPLNFAYRACSLGERVTTLSRLGDDALGEEARAAVRELGLDPAWVQSDPVHPTGTVQVRFDAAGHPDYTIVPEAAYDYIVVTPEMLAAARGADCFCFGTVAQRHPVSRAACHELLAAAGGAVKLLDLNLRRDCYTAATVEASLARTDLLKLNEQEAGQLPALLGLPGGSLREIAVQLMARFAPECCVITLAERGALAVRRGGEWAYAAGYRVPVADTIGSGDAFAAGFVHRHLHGASLAEACRFGNAMGALAASQPGATAPVHEAAAEALVAAASDLVVAPELAGGGG